jgi:hypothetical protein
MPAPTNPTGSIEISPERATEYGIVCTRPSYDCCWKEDEDYSCDPCVEEGETKTCATCTREVTKCDEGHNSSAKSAFQTVRVVSKPTINDNDFTANPEDILYTEQDKVSEQGYYKYSTLAWRSLAANLGSLSRNLCSIQGDDGTKVNNLESVSNQRFSPSRTTVYTIQCRNSDSLTPATCYSDSDTKDVRVRVFKTGIEEQKPPTPPQTMIDFEKMFGNIIKALMTFGR